MNNSLITFTIDGEILTDNRITARHLSKTLDSLQGSIDRAYLDIKYGGVWKHARLPAKDYIDTDFIVLDPRSGSFILDLISGSQSYGRDILERINQAITPAYERSLNYAEDEVIDLLGPEAVKTRSLQVQNQILIPQQFNTESIMKDGKTRRAYGDKSIVKEIDQALTIVRNKESGDSSFELKIITDNTKTFTFNRANATAFHKIISSCELGNPYIYRYYSCS